MKRCFLCIVFCLVSSIGICYAQERVNRPKLSFNTEGAIISNITGWYYNDIIGEWVKSIGLLEAEKKYTNMGPSWRSHSYNNIISLQFKTITYNDISYYVLVWDKWTGAYKYPTIYEDWEYWRTKIFFMFTEKDMEKLRNLTNNPSTIEILTLTRGRLDQNVQDVDVIQYEMNNNFQQKSKIEIYKATDGSVRFLFKEGLFSGIHKIETSYFEISELDYNKLMNIKL